VEVSICVHNPPHSFRMPARLLGGRVNFPIPSVIEGCDFIRTRDTLVADNAVSRGFAGIFRRVVRYIKQA
jgi:hypothetical protein